VYKLSETGLALDEGEGDFRLLAEARQPEHELYWVHIGCNNYQLGLLFLDQIGDVVESELQHDRLLSIMRFLIMSLLILFLLILYFAFSGRLETSGLFFMCFRGVFLQELNERLLLIAVEGASELIDYRGDL
jgi:hypothetical protein